MSRLHLTGADMLAVAIGGLTGIVVALGILEAWLRRCDR